MFANLSSANSVALEDSPITTRSASLQQGSHLDVSREILLSSMARMIKLKTFSTSMIGLSGRDNRSWATPGSRYSDNTGGISADLVAESEGTDRRPSKGRTAATGFLSLPADLHPKPWGGSSFPPGRSVSYFNLECSKPGQREPQPRDTVYSKHAQESIFPTNCLSSEDPKRQAVEWTASARPSSAALQCFVGGRAGACMSWQLV